MDSGNQAVEQTQPVQAAPSMGKIPQAKKPFSKILLVVIVLLLLFFLAGTIFLLTRSKKAVVKIYPVSASPSNTQASPTLTVDLTANPDSIGASWKTYNNSTYNFSFKYPESWSPNVSQQDNYGIRTQLVGFKNFLRVYILSNSQKLTTVEFIKQLPNYEGRGSVHPLSNQPNYFSKLDAIEANGFGGAGMTGNQAFINDGKGDIINLFTSDIPQNTIDTIFSTFKFTH